MGLCVYYTSPSLVRQEYIVIMHGLVCILYKSLVSQQYMGLWVYYISQATVSSYACIAPGLSQAANNEGLVHVL